MKFAFAATGILCAVGSVQASTFYIGHDPNFSPSDTAIFDDTVLAGGGTTATIPGIDTHGINVKSIHVNESDGFWGYAFPGGNGTPSCYFNGGQNDTMSVTPLGGGRFGTIETMVGAGWGGPTGYFWVQTFLGGSPVDSYDFDANYGTILGIRGGDFDEVRIAGYNDAGTRDQHNETNYSAGAIDNFAWGAVPTPGSAAVLGLGALAAGRRRR